MKQDCRQLRIAVPVHHDGWNQHWTEVLSHLNDQCPHPDHDKVKFLVPEGISLYEMGVIAMIQQWQASTGFTDDSISIECHNTVEHIPYANSGFGACILNEGLHYSRYLPVKTNAKKFGLFIGRLTLPRVCMAWHMQHYHDRDTLMSWMIGHARSQIEKLDQVNWMHDLVPYKRDLSSWWRAYSVDAVKPWYKFQRPGSIDGRRWEEQYQEDRHSTNRSLIEHYDKFCIEIVAETSNYGNNFWITEKTVRPIVTGKPFLIFGARNFLSRLRSLGFRTFNSLWDESYDNYDGLRRWMVMRDVIAELAKMPRVPWQDLMLSAHAIALENYKHYHSLAPWKVNDYWPRDSQQVSK